VRGSARLHLIRHLMQAEATASASDEAARATARRLEAAEAQLDEALGRAGIDCDGLQTASEASKRRARGGIFVYLDLQLFKFPRRLPSPWMTLIL